MERKAEDREFGWSTWLPRLGLDAAPPPRRLRFSQFGPALSAAVDGLGVALGRSPMVDAELAAGRLVRLLPKRVAAKASQVFALAWRDFRTVGNDQRIATFRDFALDRCAAATTPFRAAGIAAQLCRGRRLIETREVELEYW